jgi:hypothetical protein
VFLLNSRLGHLIATLKRSRSKFFHAQGYPFSLSYGVRLPSSLTRVLSNTLGFLPQPTRVGLRYGRSPSSNEVFLDSVGSAESPWVAPQLPPLLGLSKGGFSSPRAYDWRRAMSIGHAQPTFLYSPRLNENGRCWNINQISIAYAFRPRLRPD